MQRPVGSWTLSLLVLAASTLMPSLTRAQDHDAAFCSMLDAIGAEAPERVGDLSSGTVSGDAPVVVRREVLAHTSYVVLVALSAPASAASVLPVARAGDEAPHREGTRIAHDFSARSSGEVTLSFQAPSGTRYHAALYRLPPPRRSELGIRPFARALHSGSGLGSLGSLRGEPPRPPDCRPAATSILGGGGQPPEARVGRLVIRGSMPPAEVTRVVSGGRAQLAFCAMTHGASDLTLRLVVSPTGEVQAASTDGPPPLGTCVARTARRWRFPATGGGITAVDVPISFGPSR